MQPKLRILHLEDSATDAELIALTLKREGIAADIKIARSRLEFEAALSQQSFDLVLSDYGLPDFTGTDALAFARAKDPNLPFILLSGTVGEEQAVESLKNGATDYILKQRLTRLGPAIRRAIEEARRAAEQAKAEEELRKSEERFQIIARATNEIIWDWDLTNNNLWWNEAFCSVFGYPPEEIEPGIESWTSRLHPGDKDSVLTGIYSVINAGGNAWADEYRFRCRDGSYAYVLDRGYVLRDSSGKPVRMLGAMMDISERKRAEETLREQAALLEKASDAIVVCDMQGCIVFWNTGAQRIYGWEKSEALGKNLSELLDGKDARGIEPILKSTLDKGEWSGELLQLTKDRKNVTVQSRWTCVRNSSDEATSILVINTDITEKKQLESQFLRAQRMESIGVLAGGIAHDLNNVLAPILMVSQLLKMNETNPETLRWLDTMETSAQQGADLIKQVLAFARGVEGERVQMQVGHLVRDIQKIIQETFPRSITIKADVPKDLWTIEGVAAQLNQVLMNLCVNARDAMLDGGRLTLTAENIAVDEGYARLHAEAKAGNYVVISVTDTGVGIPSQLLERIYDPFFTTKDIGKGTGLGLSTVKGIVKSHDGFIHVYSEQGKGTTFRVYFPALTVASTATQTQPTRNALPRGLGETVLVVDDEESIRNIIKVTLQRFNYKVLVAGDGVEGLSTFMEHKNEVRLVLTDIMMPLLEGRALIRALQRIDPKLQFIALSGLMDPQQIDEIAGAGVIPFISKPFTAEKLLVTVDAVLHPKS